MLHQYWGIIITIQYPNIAKIAPILWYYWYPVSQNCPNIVVLLVSSIPTLPQHCGIIGIQYPNIAPIFWYYWYPVSQHCPKVLRLHQYCGIIGIHYPDITPNVGILEILTHILTQLDPCNLIWSSYTLVCGYEVCLD